jgi:hypothetical protein
MDLIAGASQGIAARVPMQRTREIELTFARCGRETTYWGTMRGPLGRSAPGHVGLTVIEAGAASTVAASVAVSLPRGEVRLSRPRLKFASFPTNWQGLPAFTPEAGGGERSLRFFKGHVELAAERSYPESTGRLP